MPLTVRTNGSSGSNIISASWFNDFLNLFTGQMTDQEVTFQNNLVLKAIGAAPSSAPTLATAAGTTLGIGVYKYEVTFISPDGESLPGPQGTVTTTSGNQAVAVSAIPTGPTGTTGRRIYRTTVGGSTFYLDNTLNDNTTTSYTDTSTDASITSGGGTNPPTHPTFGGSLIVKDQTGTVKYTIANDGTILGGSTGLTGSSLTITGTSSLDNGNITTNGSGILTAVSAVFRSVKIDDPSAPSLNGATSGTLKIYQLTRGTTVKITLAQYNNFKNGGGSVQTLGLPVAYTTSAVFITTDVPAFTIRLGSGGSDLSGQQIVTSLASGGGGNTSVTSVNNWSFGSLIGNFDTIACSSGNTNTHSGYILMIGI